MTVNYEFGSDNHSGVHPDIIKAIESANVGYSVAYGDDEYTAHAIKKLKEHFVSWYMKANTTASRTYMT